jgi:hypothetical protein
MNQIHRALIGVIVSLTLASAAAAQVSTAILQGVVTDAQSGVLPGVSVTITNVDTGLTRDTSSDAAGFFRVTALPPGPYTIQAKLDGFASYSRTGLLLTIGQTATVDIALTLASLTEAVVVQGSTPIVDTSSNALSTTVNQAQLDDLPLAGRDFQSLANLAPGVTGVGGGGINAGGQLNRNNSVVVDGTSNDEQGIAGSRGSFSLESVREYVVYTNQFAAEFGQASGAIVNVVSRSGTNKVEGRVFAFDRDDALDAQNPFSKAQNSGKAPFYEFRGGGFLGGPLVKNRWHYFASYEGLKNETTSVITSPLVPVDQREVPLDNTRNQFFFKTDYQLPRNNRMEFRYRRDANLQTGLGIGGLNPRERGYDNDNRYSDGVLSMTSLLSSRTVNEARVLVGKLYTFYLVDGYADPTGVSISRPSINLGKANNMPQGWWSTRVEVVDTLSHAVGRHEFKFGTDIQLDDQDTYFLGNKDGTFTFRTDAPFDPNNQATYPFQYTQTIGDWYDPRKNQMYSAFAQDMWRVDDRVTLTLGVRFDTETMFAHAKAIAVDQDYNNFAPRLGVVWTPFANGRTVVRGGFGIYYDQGFNNISGNISNSARSSNVTVLNPGFPDPYAGGTISPTRPSVTVAAPVIDTPSTRTLSVGTRRELASGFAVGVDYVRALGYQLFNAIDTNAPLPGSGLRPNPSYLRVVQYETTGRSWSDALLMSVERRLGRGPLVNASYTLSRQVRTVEDFGFTPADSFNRAAEKALANNNRTNQFVASIVWPLPYGLQAAGLVQARSGLPWTVTTGSDNNGDSNINDRPDLVNPNGDPASKASYSSAFTGRAGNLGRNTNSGPAFAQVDLRLSKFVTFGNRYSFEGFAEAFNLLNRANLGVPNGTLTSALFGQPTALATNATPRQVELGFRFNF